jgi:hypothetical protein
MNVYFTKILRIKEGRSFSLIVVRLSSAAVLDLSPELTLNDHPQEISSLLRSLECIDSGALIIADAMADSCNPYPMGSS